MGRFSIPSCTTYYKKALERATAFSTTRMAGRTERTGNLSRGLSRLCHRHRSLLSGVGTSRRLPWRRGTAGVVLAY